MTIVVYCPETDRFAVDSCHQIAGSFRPIDVALTKIMTSPAGHRYASTGSGDDIYIGLLIDSALLSLAAGVAPIIDMSDSDVDLFVRDVDGRAFISMKHGEKIILTHWTLPFPRSRGSGNTFFDAFYLEHRSLEVAMELTCRHAFGCGLPIEFF